MRLRVLYIILILFILMGCEKDNVPVAMDFSITPEQPTTIDPVQIQVNLTGPANLDTTEYVYRWDWDGDGEFDTRYSAQTSFSRIFGEPGEYNVILESLHTAGEKLTSQHTILVSQGFSAPEVDFVFSPDSGNFKTRFTFDAGGTFDAQEEMEHLTFRWDFNQDNRWDTVSRGDPVAYHRFETFGLYPVKLLVSDTTNRHAEIVKKITVHRIDTLIVPVLRIEPEFPTDRDTIYIYATDSYYKDKPDMILRYSFRPFGSNWTEPTSQGVHFWTLPPPGIFYLPVRVYSDEGLYNEGSIEVVVSRMNRKPTASISKNMRFGNILSSFEFSAWGSSDIENTPSELRARWDFEGDGVWDTQFSYEKVVRRVYQEPGVYHLTLQIVDQEGLRDIASTDIHVSPHTNPMSHFKDLRDEQVYSMVEIGGRWWMGQNLNYQPREKSGPDRALTWCYNDNPGICDITGKLYFARTIGTEYTGESEDKNICPRGWHLPTRSEWGELIQEFGFENAGRDLFYGGRSDFNALLGGYAAYFSYDMVEEFRADSIYKVAYFLTDEIPSNNATTVQIVRDKDSIAFRTMPSHGYYSIRCIRDE